MSAFPYAKATPGWTATPHPGAFGGEEAWIVHFLEGRENDVDVSLTNFVRCVR